MAKTTKINEQNGKVKFRIIEFELEGSDETMQESLKNIATAFLRTSSAPNPRVIRNEGPRSVNGDAVAMPVDDILVDVADEGEPLETATEPPKRAARKTKIAPVKVLTDVRLDDVSPTLKEFCLEKAPTSDMSRYLVIAYWFKNHKALSDLTPDHFYTAYRLMAWNTPRDPAQPIRDLRHIRRGKFSAGQTPGSWQINHIGENAVNEMRAKH